MADRIVVQTEDLAVYAKRLKAASGKTAAAAFALQSLSIPDCAGASLDVLRAGCVLRALDRSVPGGELATTVRAFSEALRLCAAELDRLAAAATHSAALFEDTERNVAKLVLGNSTGDSPFDVKSGDQAIKWEDLLIGIIRSFGMAGAVLAFGLTPLVNWLQGEGFSFGDNPDEVTKNLLKAVKASASTLGKLATWHLKEADLSKLKNFGGTYYQDVRLKNLLGLNNVPLSKWLGHAPSQASEWANWTNFKNGFNTSLKNTFVTTADGAAKANWAGIIGVAADTAIVGGENFQQYKEGKISGERAVTETVVEVGGNVVVSAAATSLVATGLAAVGVASAPAVVVVAGAAAVTFGLDAGSKAIFGKPLTAAAADGAGWVVDHIPDAVHGLGKLWQSATKAVRVRGPVITAWYF